MYFSRLSCFIWVNTASFLLTRFLLNIALHETYELPWRFPVFRFLVMCHVADIGDMKYLFLTICFARVLVAVHEFVSASTFMALGASKELCWTLSTSKFWQRRDLCLPFFCTIFCAVKLMNERESPVSGLLLHSCWKPFTWAFYR